MRKYLSYATAVGAAFLAGNLFMVPVAAAEDALPTDKECGKLENPDKATQGWCVMADRKAGNCLACHDVVTKRWPSALPPSGNIAPPLVSMKARFPDKAKLRAQIYDSTVANPSTSMPPFGTHKIISDQDIDNIVEFLYSI